MTEQELKARAKKLQAELVYTAARLASDPTLGDYGQRLGLRVTTPCKLVEPRLAHAAKRAAIVGEQPSPDAFMCHRCDNNNCCAQDHLFWGSHKDNVRDAMLKGRLRKRNRKAFRTPEDALAFLRAEWRERFTELSAKLLKCRDEYVKIMGLNPIDETLFTIPDLEKSVLDSIPACEMR